MSLITWEQHLKDHIPSRSNNFTAKPDFTCEFCGTSNNETAQEMIDQIHKIMMIGPDDSEKERINKKSKDEHDRIQR